MLNEKLYRIVCDRNDLGNLLHTHYIYGANVQAQIQAKKKIEELLQAFSDAEFLELGFDQKSRDLLEELISCKAEENWREFIDKFLKGMLELLKREISKSSRLVIPPNFPLKLKSELGKIPMYHANSQITIEEAQPGVFEANLLNLECSPDYDPNQLNYYGKWESWRDTQLVFTLNFTKNLFIWDYINVHKQFQGQYMGTKSVKLIEQLASQYGFSRFTVEYPNRQYWIQKLGYSIPENYRFGDGKYAYTLEGYKEI